MPTIIDRWIRNANPELSTFEDFAIRFTKRGYGGWKVVRADNGRELGWVFKSYDTGKWSGYVPDSAFRGDGIDDTGDLLDDVPGYLSNRQGDSLRHHPVAVDYATRVGAAEQIVSWLDREHAPAMGHGRHYQVVRWEDRRRR